MSPVASRAEGRRQAAFTAERQARLRAQFEQVWLDRHKLPINGFRRQQIEDAMFTQDYELMAEVLAALNVRGR
jgi:hypothetical protein